MFYTIISRIPMISHSKSKQKFLQVFLLGSLVYILLHYYVNSGERHEFFESIKPYIYYWMAIDLALSYFISQWDAPEKNNDDKGSVDDDLNELRMLQNKNSNNAKAEEESSSQKSPFMTRDEIDRENNAKKPESSSKSSKSSQSDSSKSSKSPESTTKKSKKTESDTNINIY